MVTGDYYEPIEISQSRGKDVIIAKVSRGHAYVLDSKGNMLVDGSELDIIRIGEYINDWAVVREGVQNRFFGSFGKENNKHNYIDIDGNLISDEWFLESLPFDNNRAIVAMGESHSDGSYNVMKAECKVIDNSCNIIGNLPNQFAYERIYCDYAIAYKYKMFGVWIPAEEEGLFMISLEDPDEIFGPFKNMEFYESNYAIITDFDTNLVGLLNNNVLVLPMEYNSITHIDNLTFEYRKGETVETITVPST